MKSYLDLIPLSAKVRRRQDRMAVLCIVLAVFLVTTVFGMADMYIRAQITQVTQDNGDFHVGLVDITDEEAALIAARPDVAAVARYGVIPYEEDAPYTLFGKSILMAGCDEAMMTGILADAISDGQFPADDGEVMLTQNARDVYGVAIGDTVTITAPDGRRITCTVSGFCRDSAQTMSSDGFGAFFTTAGFRDVFAEAKGLDAASLENVNLDDVNSGLYVQFAHPFFARQAIADLKADMGLSDDQVVENIKLLGLYGQSSSSTLMQIYITALVLGLLVLTSGVLMIASSMNTRVAQRTQFYGMMRCLGATPKQVMRLVRREALRWCRFAIPCGVLAGSAVVIVLCAVLRRLAPDYFAEMPVLAVSVPAIASGIVLGFVTVRLAARAPAKRAAGVSPLVAVSGNATDQLPARSAASTRHLRVETALGIHHACASRKNLLLMTGSFAFSIILFLGFSVAVDMMGTALRPLQPWTPDVSIASADGTCSIDPAQLESFADDGIVDAAYGSMLAQDLPAAGEAVRGTADLASYRNSRDGHSFDWAADQLIAGDLAAAETTPHAALAVYREDSGRDPLAVGDVLTLTVNGTAQDVTVVGLLSQSPFVGDSDLGTLIVSEDTFRALTGEDGYSTIDLQLAPNASDADVNALRAQAGDGVTFIDDRLSNASARGTYYCFALFVYGFLAVIALIAVFNVVNSIAMSVSARTRQYGVYRALGLTDRQLTRMIASEAATYIVLGGVLGTLFGLICHYLLFTSLLTEIWGMAWTLPLKELAIILTVLVSAGLIAVRRPTARISAQAIADTIAEE